MPNEEREENDHQLAGLTRFQSGLVFVLIATALIAYVGYQVAQGRVFTKSGELPLGSGMSFGWLTLEAVAAAVGLVRGVRMLRN